MEKWKADIKNKCIDATRAFSHFVLDVSKGVNALKPHIERIKYEHEKDSHRLPAGTRVQIVSEHSSSLRAKAVRQKGTIVSSSDTRSDEKYELKLDDGSVVLYDQKSLVIAHSKAFSDFENEKVLLG